MSKAKSYSPSGRISKNFLRTEFACRCGCGFDSVDPELAYVVQGVRDTFNKPVVLTSACRCKKHNKSVGGHRKSKHLEGIAADIVVIGMNQKDVYSHLNTLYPDKYGIGKYSDFTHIDIQQTKRRW